MCVFVSVLVSMCVYMCLCAYVCVHVCLCTCVCVCVYNIYVFACERVFVCLLCVCMCACVHTYDRLMAENFHNAWREGDCRNSQRLLLRTTVMQALYNRTELTLLVQDCFILSCTTEIIT